MSDLDRLDYYALFGIARDASPDAVRAAFHAYASLHHPDRHAGAHPEVRAAATAWFRRGAEAYRVLSDPGRRAAYDAGLADGRLRYDATAVPQPPPPSADAPLSTSVGKAAPFLKKALDALSTGNVEAARMNLQFVAQFDPGNAAVRAKLAAL